MSNVLHSPRFYFALATLLAIGALLSLFDLRTPSRAVRPLEAISDLRGRDLNVLFVLIDTLRADRLGAWGYERDTSPMLDEVASAGVRFENVVAQSTWTKCSMASLWTARYPAQTGVLRWSDGLADSTVMPAEIFREHGYRTAGIYRNGWVAPNFGFAQGFDHYAKTVAARTPARFSKRAAGRQPLHGTDEDLTRAAEEFLRSFGHEPFFLYVHYMDVHQYAYDESSALFGTRMPDFYDNAIRWTDRNLGVLLGTLEALGLSDRTIIVIGSDHGESFDEHGAEGHARSLYTEVTHVPLVLSLPFRLHPGVVVPDTVENIDIFPTLFEMLGFDEVLPDAAGRSLVPNILAAAGDERPGSPDPAFAHLDRNWGRPEEPTLPIVAVTAGDDRLIQLTTEPPPGLDPRRRVGVPVDGPELYDRAADPTEQHNLAAERPERVDELTRLIDGYLQAGADTQAPQVEMNDMQRGQLRALGYVSP